MSKEKVKEKVINIAHEFAKKYGEQSLRLNENELMAYIIPYFSEIIEINTFRYYKWEMLNVFFKTVKEDLKH